MRWTKEKPTVPGWYWYREPGRWPHLQESDPQPYVLSVHRRDHWFEKEPAPLRVQEPFMDYDHELDDFNGEWFGPIEPPA